MRVIAGFLGGRVFASPHGNRTHPMSEKARGALFNVLGDIQGLSVLDAYAGSGAVGIEALSRGADAVVAFDADKNAIRTIRENAQQLGLENKLKATQQTAVGWSAAHEEAQFDLVFADPPYNDIHIAHVERLLQHVALGGIYCVSWPGARELPVLVGATQIAQKSLGDIQLVFYRKK